MFSHDVTAAIIVFQNNERTAMLVSQTNLMGVELFCYVPLVSIDLFGGCHVSENAILGSLLHILSEILRGIKLHLIMPFWYASASLVDV